MPLLKDNNAQRIHHEAVVLDLGDLRKAAEQLRAEAQAEADRIIAEARTEAQQITVAASEQGHAEGLAKGTEQGLREGRAAGHAEALQQSGEQLAQIQQAWVAAAQQWDSERRQMVLDAKQSLLELALHLAQKIVHRLPQTDPSLVVDQVAATVEHIAHPADATIHIHPADRALVDEALPELIETVATLQHAHLHDNADITPGGCIVTYGRGAIDAQIETQLNRIVETLLPGATDTTVSQETTTETDTTEDETNDEPQADTDQPTDTEA